MNDSTTPEAWAKFVGAAKAQGINGNGHGTTLGIAVRQFADPSDWATPTIPNGGPGTSPARLGGENLHTQAAQFAPPSDWATPTSRDEKDGSCAGADVPTNALLGHQVVRATMPDGPPSSPTSRSSRPHSKARLNPLFDEWLMGWPLGLTDFAHVGTESSLWRRRMRSSLSRLAQGSIPRSSESDWPTPCATDAQGAMNELSGRQSGSRHHAGTTLTDAIRQFEEPQAP